MKTFHPKPSPEAEGRSAWHKGVPFHANPYRFGKDKALAADWSRGWTKAQRESLKANG